MTMKQKLTIIVTSLAGFFALAAKILSGEGHFDLPTVLVMWGTLSPAIGVFSAHAAAQAAIDKHLEAHHDEEDAPATKNTSASGRIDISGLVLLVILSALLIFAVGCGSIPQSHVDADVAEYDTIVVDYATYLRVGKHADGTPMSAEERTAKIANVHIQGAGIRTLTGTTPTATAVDGL